MVLRRKKRGRNNKGFTLMELLVVVGILAILALMIFLILDPMTQIRKAHDSKRKTDLRKLQNALEDFYNDNNRYPDNLNQLAPNYLSELPLDPATNNIYAYNPSGNVYRIYAALEYEQDPDIGATGCQDGCGPGGETGACDYNYGVASANTDLESCPPCPSTIGCQPGGGGICNQLTRCDGATEKCWTCPKSKWFCSKEECLEKCPGHPESYCTFHEEWE